MSTNALADARAKLDRAKLLTEALRADIREAGQGEPYTIPLREELDQDTGTLYIRVDRDTARPEQWGLLIGDVLHNFRSALDCGWWQLARRHFGREPTEKEARQIQFPILKAGGKWDPGNYRGTVGVAATKFVGKLQPDPGGYPPNTSHPLADLQRLSNIDKHRSIHTTVQRLHELSLKIKPEGTPGAEMEGFRIICDHHPGPVKAGDEVLRTPPGYLTRYPKVKLDTYQTGFIAIEGGNESVQTTLEGISQFVDAVLAGFSHILMGNDVPDFTVEVGPKRI